MKTLNISRLIASFSALMLFVLTSAANDSAAPDSVMKIPGPAKVVITEDANGLNFDIDGEEQSTTYRVNYSPTSRVRVSKTYRTPVPLSFNFSKNESSSTGVSMEGVSGSHQSVQSAGSRRRAVVKVD